MLGRLPVVFNVIFVGGILAGLFAGPSIDAIMLIQFSCVPVALARYGLRTPMRPDAELGISEPIGIFVLLEGFVGRLEFTFGDWEVGGGRGLRVLREQRKEG